MSAALPAADHPPKRGTLKKVGGPDGQASTVGRKPLGEFSTECDKNYRNTGMRHKTYSDLTWKGDVAYGLISAKTLRP